MRKRLAITTIFIPVLLLVFLLCTPQLVSAQSGNPTSVADRIANAATHTIAAGIPSTGDPAADLAALMGLSATLLTLAKAARISETASNSDKLDITTARDNPDDSNMVENFEALEAVTVQQAVNQHHKR